MVLLHFLVSPLDTINLLETGSYFKAFAYVLVSVVSGIIGNYSRGCFSAGFVMKIDVIFVRVYITEADKLLNAVMAYLHDEIHVKGVTVFRAITGFGKSGALHSSQLLSMSLDLPLAIEFFDEADKVVKAIEHLSKMLEANHIVSWPAVAYE